MALNSSAIYLGQAAGAASGGWLIAHDGYGSLNWLGVALDGSRDRAQRVGRAPGRGARMQRAAD